MKKRRIKRRLKAAASIVVALAAGTFLACKSGLDTAKQAIADAQAPADSPADSPADAPSDAAGPIADARADAMVRYKARPQDAAVDVQEHRKGMPVPDNLLE